MSDLSFEERFEERQSILMESKEAGIPKSCFKFWEGNEKGVQRRIVSAANRFIVKETGETLVIASARHYSSLMTSTIRFLASKGIELSAAYGENQGFIDQFDDYHTREEALVIAQWANQLPYEKCHPVDELFSEDLYR